MADEAPIAPAKILEVNLFISISLIFLYKLSKLRRAKLINFMANFCKPMILFFFSCTFAYFDLKLVHNVKNTTWKAGKNAYFEHLSKAQIQNMLGSIQHLGKTQYYDKELIDVP